MMTSNDQKNAEKQEKTENAKVPEGVIKESAMARTLTNALAKDATGVAALLRQLAVTRGGSNEKESKPEHRFWRTQPVPQTDEPVLADGPIEEDKKVEDIRAEPYPLPESFEWCEFDMDHAEECKEVYQLLTQNYVEDEDAMFRFDYSAAFLSWALKPPGHQKVWNVGVRVSGNKKLVAFISGIPVNVSVRSKHIKQVEINFLCVHKKLRSKRLAPVLIKEITRRVNRLGLFQAIYTAGVVLPKPIATARYAFQGVYNSISSYFHRSLNPKKLIETGFSHLPRGMTMMNTIKLYRVPEKPQLPGIRPMTLNDVAKVHRLLSSYLARFQVYHLLDLEEVKHWFVPIPDVIYSYVVEDEKFNITDFVSFYSLPSTVIRHPTHREIRAAYCYYYAVQDVERVTSLMQDALTFAKQNNFDVFNCLNIMDNEQFIEPLKFGKGDGFLQYYLYNYRTSPLLASEMGMLLL